MYGHKCSLLSVYLLIRTENGKSRPNVREISENLGCSVRTVKNRLEKLVSEGWITPIEKVPGKYNVLGINKLCMKVSGEQAGQWWLPAQDVSMLKKILLAGLIDMWNAYHRELDRQSPDGLRGIHFGGCAASVISKKTGLSKSWALKWQRILRREGLIRIQRRNIEVDITWEQLDRDRSDAEMCAAVYGVIKTFNNKCYTRAANILTPTFSTNLIRKNYCAA